MIKKLMLYFILSISCVYAEEVKMLTSVPSSENLMKMLRKRRVEQMSDLEKTRKVEWTKKNSSTAEVESIESLYQVLGIPIQFQYDSDIIKTVSREFVEVIGKALKENSEVKLLIEGHTDASGSAEYNMKLSKKRAISIKDYLVKTYQLSSESIVVSGQGENKPLNGLSPYSDKNRRVQISLL